MNEPNETRVFYRAVADFAALRRELTAYRRALAATQASETAFNAQSAKDRAASTKAATARAKAINAESAALKVSAARLRSYNLAAAKTTPATRAATAQIQAQNRALLTNATRLAAAAKAGRDYADAQKRIATSTGPSASAFKTLEKDVKALKDSTAASEENSRALKENAQAHQAAKRATVEFVEGVGDVDTATGEVTETTKEATEATNRWASALTRTRSNIRGFLTNSAAVTRAQEALNHAREAQGDAAARARIAELQLADAVRRNGEESHQAISAQLRLERAQRVLRAATDAATGAQVRFQAEGRQTRRVMGDLDGGARTLHRSFTRFGNWRPRLVPPFVALIPIIGAVIAAMNPLVSMIGAMGPLILGLASNIGSLSGAFLALPGILSGVVAGISSVIASMGGVGSVFKTYSAMQKATGRSGGGGGTGGPTQAERAQALADAEWNLSKAQRNVTKAQERLNDARQEALRDLIDLRMEVSRASLTEERAIADLRLAQEEYWNVMADPGSTLGDKLDAAAAIKEAEADLQDVRQKNIDNQLALTEAERKGINNSEKVLDAQESLTDALIAQRDAQKGLAQEQSGGAVGAAAVTALNEYNDALAKLSPSARKFVLAIIAMQAQWESFRLSMQETFFSQFVNDLDRLPRLVNTLASFLRPAAAAMGTLVSNTLRMLDTPIWSRDLATIGDQNGVVITKLGEALLYMATALKDIVIAAGPFTEWMVTGFAEGNKNFADMIANARQSGSLANWLTTVETRLRKWWQIVKNIGATLFNYGAASSEFGDWLSDGLLALTEGWKRSSELARNEDSPFRQWLNSSELRGLLLEIRGLFGDFFSWFRRESMDPKNMAGAQRLVSVIRNELGPALGRLLDSLADTNIDEKFVSALSAIIGSLDALIENGGAEAFETFFHIVESFFQIAKDLVDFLGPAVGPLAAFAATFSALAFIGKFTGITSLIGWLLRLAPVAPGIGAFFGGFKGLSLLKFGGILAMVGALVGLPGILGSIRDGFNGLLNIDTSTITAAAKTFERLSPNNGEAFRVNEFNQSRNWVFDAGRQFRGSDAAWQKVDDQLRSILDTGDLEAFQEAWRELVGVVGSDASEIWSLTYRDAQEAGAAISEAGDKAYHLSAAADEAEGNVKRLREELFGLGGTARSQGAAIDQQTESIRRLNTMQGINLQNYKDSSEEGVAFRSVLRDIETDSLAAAQAILDNGGSVEDAEAAYRKGREEIEKYLVNLGLSPDAARAFADSQLGSMDEVIAKLVEVQEEADKASGLRVLEFEVKWRNSLGIKEPTPMPTTQVDGREVIDFAANGRQNGSARPSSDRPSAGGGSAGGGAGGAGGGMSVGMTFGLREAVERETTQSKSIWETFWSNLARPTFGPLGAVVSGFTGAKNRVRSEAMGPLASETKGSLKDIENNGFNPFKSATGGVASALTSMRNRSRDEALNPMAGDAKRSLKDIENNAFNPFKSAGDTISTAFSRVADGLSATWARLRSAFAAPVNFVINTVYNNGIRSFWNTINDSLNLKMGLPRIEPIKYAEGGVLPGYTPGRDVHDFSSPTGGRLQLSGGEAIMRPEWTRAIGGPKAVAEMNKKAKNGQKFANGGVFGRPQAFAQGGVWEVAGDIFDKFTGLFNNPGKFITDGIGGIVNPLMSSLTGSPYGQLLSGIPGAITKGLVGSTEGKLKQAKRAQPKAPPGSSGMGWKAQWDIVRNQFPNAVKYSDYRPNDKWSWAHGAGRAIDITPSMGIFNWLKENYPNSQALIYSPANRRQLRNGSEYMWGEPERSMHYNHVHWAMKNGGVIPGLFDNGGWLNHGQMGINLTGKPEAVLDPDESRGLKALLSGSGLRGGAANLGAVAGVTPAMSNTRVVDNSVNIEKLVMNNPVPERSSESLPKAIRRVGYMNNARSNA